MSIRSYYDVLGVASSSEPEVIDAAYRALMRKYHPDRTHGDVNAERRAREVNEAFQNLKDPEKRRQYDHRQLSKGQLAHRPSPTSDTPGTDVRDAPLAARGAEEYKFCPRCAEKIRSSAKICRFCGLQTLASSEPSSCGASQTNIYNQLHAPQAPLAQQQTGPSWIRSCLLLALVLATGVFFLFATGFWTAEVREGPLPPVASTLDPSQTEMDTVQNARPQEEESADTSLVSGYPEYEMIDVPSIASVEPAPGIQVALTADWLSGPWLRNGDGSCPGDSGETFSPDGTWSTWSEQGSWVMSGNELAIRVTHTTGADSPSGQPEPLPTPSNVRGFIQEANDNRFVWLTAQNQRVRFQRCTND